MSSSKYRDGGSGASVSLTNAGAYYGNAKNVEDAIQGAGAKDATQDTSISTNTTNIATNLASIQALNKPIEGAALTNADVTKNPASDGASEYTLPAATLSANHTLTLGVTGSPPTGLIVTIVRRDRTNKTYAVINGGTNGGTMFTFAASPGQDQAISFMYNSVDWVPCGFQYVAAAG